MKYYRDQAENELRRARDSTSSAVRESALSMANAWTLADIADALHRIADALEGQNELRRQLS